MKIKVNSIDGMSDIHSKYEISRDGKFFVEGVVSKGSTSKKGYIQVRLQTQDKAKIRCFRLHRLIALAFVENPKPELFDEVNHDNGIKSCNEDWNLSWTDRIGNQKHAFDTGLWDANRKLNQTEIENILIDTHDCILSLTAIAKKYRIHRTTVSDIFYARHYQDILNSLDYLKPFEFAEEFHKSSQKTASLTEEKVIAICKLYEKGFSYNAVLEIAELSDIPLHVLKDIRRRRGYRKISDQFHW